MKSMKIALLGATFLIGAGFAANAADLGGHRGSLKDEPMYAPAFTWTGFYVGAHLGGTFGDELTPDNSEYRTVDIDNGFLAGGHLGYNLQTSGSLVLGIEGDLSASGADYTSYLASIRGRLGVAAGNTLFYGTAGVAFVGWDDDANDDLDATAGWVAGLGVEHKLTHNLSIGVEGLYYSFNDKTYDVDFDRDLWAVRGRLNYHFGADRAALK